MLRNSYKSFTEAMRRIAEEVNAIIYGKWGSVTLEVTATETVVSDARVSINTVVTLTPTTANAASELTSTYISEIDVTTGQFTITHQNNALADRTFNYTLEG